MPLILSENARLRLSYVTSFYFAQGIPGGLFWVVIPAWMAANGAPASDIAKIIAAAGLPPSFKFLFGLLFDRYGFLALGRRKPWIIAGQVLMAASFLAGAVLLTDSNQVLVLVTVAFLSQTGQSIQDVAVDSLTIDLFDEAGRAKAVGLTMGASFIGMAATMVIGGRLVEVGSVQLLFGVSALVPFLIAALALPIRERPGEKLVPWGRGKAHPHNLALQPASWIAVLKTSVAAVLAPLPLLLAFACMARFIYVGINDTLHSILATQGAGWQISRLTELQTMTAVTAAVAGIAFGLFVVARIGPRKSLVVVLVLNAMLYAIMSFSPAARTDDTTLTAYFFAYSILYQFVTVALLPICMRLCHPAVAATHFSLFMAATNVGRPVGAWLAGEFGFEAIGGLFLLTACIFVGLAVLFALVRFRPVSAMNAAGAAQPVAT